MGTPASAALQVLSVPGTSVPPLSQALDWTFPDAPEHLREFLHQHLCPALRDALTHELKADPQARAAVEALGLHTVREELARWHDLAPDQYQTLDHLQERLAELDPDVWTRLIDVKLDEVLTRIITLRAAIDTLPGKTADEFEERRIAGEQRRLQALLIHRTDFVQNRRAAFVGRATELAEVREHIADLLPTGGYLIITGRAGQGKSSLVAALVADAPPEGILHHFIPLDPGPDYQVPLLRDLLARLILRFGLPEFYAEPVSRAALVQYFHRALTDVADQGRRLVICIDGLDQLPEDAPGGRDLALLPPEPPAGIVFVLGTRPNDTFQPLELRKPRRSYPLPDLSRPDFEELLRRRGAALPPHILGRFYEALERNALYLDLAAAQLAHDPGLDIEALLNLVADDPGQLFSIPLERLQRQEHLRDTSIRPVLAALLVAQEPLPPTLLRNLLGLAADRLSRALERLGGLVMPDGQGRYTLVHLKFRDFLREDPQHPTRNCIFSREEEAAWHARLADWSTGGDPDSIWQSASTAVEAQRAYGRAYYIAHLFYAGNWGHLQRVLDSVNYGRAKLAHDPSTRAYALDLDWGRRAADAKDLDLGEAIDRLPALWRWTLLRTSLTSTADAYPEEAYESLVLAGDPGPILARAELLSDPNKQARILARMAHSLATVPSRLGLMRSLLLRALDLAAITPDADTVSHVLTIADMNDPAQRVAGEFLVTRVPVGSSELVRTLVVIEWWEAARRTADAIRDPSAKVWALGHLASALVAAGQDAEAAPLWEAARRTADTITILWQQADALLWLTLALGSAAKWEAAGRTAEAIGDPAKRARAWLDLAAARADSGQYTEAASLWETARRAADTVTEPWEYYSALRNLVISLAQSKQWEAARHTAEAITEPWRRDAALCYLVSSLAQSGQWEAARRTVEAITTPWEQVIALGKLATSLAFSGQHDEAGPLWEAARRIAETITDREPMFDKSRRDQVLSQLTADLARTAQWEAAYRTAEAISDQDDQILALGDLAVALTTAGQHTEAGRLWEAARRTADAITDPNAHAWALGHLATSLAAAGQHSQAAPLWKTARLGGDLADRNERAGGIQARSLRELAVVLGGAGQWEAACRAAEAITVPEEQAAALRELATALAAAGENVQAAPVWEAAHRSAAAIVDRVGQATALGRLATALTAAGQHAQIGLVWEAARRAAISIWDPEEQTRALRDLATGLIVAGQWEAAQRAAEAMSDNDDQVAALSDLATALANAGELTKAIAVWKAARRTADASTTPWVRGRALMSLVTSLAQSGQWEAARRTAEAITDPLDQVQALGNLAAALASAGQHAEANLLWEIAHRTADTITGREPVTEESWQAQALSHLVTTLTATERWQAARGTADAIVEPDLRAWALLRLAVALVAAGAHSEARPVWETARRAADAIVEPHSRAWALLRLAAALDTAEQHAEACLLWEAARRAADAITNREAQARMLSELTVALARAGQWDAAHRTAEAIAAPAEQDGGLREVASALAQANQWAAALHTIGAIRDPAQQGSALRELAAALVTVGDWTQARLVAREIADPEIRAAALSLVVQHLVATADSTEALRIVQHAWRTATTRAEALALLPLAGPFFPTHPTLGPALLVGFTWADIFLQS